jgi:hypothetical protein
MANGQPCCGQCQDRGYCATDIACCLECHMSMEENKCAPYLPPHVLALLKQEHRRISANGFQRADLERHSQWEEALFRQHRVPPHILHQIHIDHAAFENGRLRSRIG